MRERHSWLQAQRAGMQASDSVNLFPNIWEWKQPGYEHICSDFLATLTPEEQLQADLQQYPGFFEAGSAPLCLVSPPSLRAYVTAHRCAALQRAAACCGGTAWPACAPSA